MQSKNIVKSFLKTLETNPKFKVLKVKKDNQWEDIPRSKLFNNIQNCILQLKDRNIEKGDRVAYKGNNSLEWISWNLATPPTLRSRRVRRLGMRFARRSESRGGPRPAAAWARVSCRRRWAPAAARAAAQAPARRLRPPPGAGR